MASTCVGCDNPFERKTKGFNRASVRSFTSPRTFSILLPGKDSYSEGYLCPDCQRQIRSNTVPRQGTKKRTLPSPTYMSAKRARLGQRQNNGPEREMTNLARPQWVTIHLGYAPILILYHIHWRETVKILAVTSIPKWRTPAIVSAWAGVYKLSYGPP